jgi:4-amino-4-deoxy-L-arabinose transferase-like glycosyltransferase
VSTAATRIRPHRVALLGVVGFSAVLESVRLGQNGWANQYYSAAVRSMLGSLHNFFFVSSDPGGLITVDKPPLGLWLQTVSAAIFGFHPLSLLVPEVVCGVLAVLVVYWIVAPRAGAWAGVAAAATLAVFPSFVASARDNNLDALLILLMSLSCLTGLWAIERASWRWLAATAVLVGLAFNTKTLAAFLVLPGLAVAWLVCARVPLRRRVAMLAGATAVLAVVSLVWIVAVQLVPASERPYVGGTNDNSELTLSFGHNGLGRVLGERNAPGHIVHAADVAGVRAVLTAAGGAGSGPHRQTGSTSSVGPVSPGRLFDHELGDQGAWMLPLALAGLVALIAVVWRRRKDRRLALLLVGGGWFGCEVVLLSVATGIVHPYYVSALGPGVAIMVGAGAAAFAELARRRWELLVVPIVGLVLTVYVARLLAHREFNYLPWLWKSEAIVIALAIVAMVASRRLVALGLGVALAAALAFPTVYSATVWQVPVEGTFPVAGPYIQDNVDFYGIPPDDVDSYRTLLRYVRPREPGARWDVLTEGANTAAVFTLLGGRAAAMGGYGTIDPALTPASLGGLVERGETRYVALGGGYAHRGGNAASSAVAAVCRRLAPQVWRRPLNIGTATHPRYEYPHGGWNLVLYDCAGRTRELRAAER